MRWFKKQTPPEDPVKELNYYINVYASCIEDDTYTKHDRFDTNEETIITRDNIHSYFQKLNALQQMEYAPVVASLDIRWRNTIQENKTSDFKIVDINRVDALKSEWWLWIDQLETLSPEDLSTI